MAKDHNFIDLLKSLTSKRMFIVLLLGFSSGLPIMLLYSVIKIWMRREGVDIGTIGYLSWMTLPYTFNFLWSFLLDRFVPSSLGRRRSWLLITQLGLISALGLLFFADPKVSVPFIAFAGTLLCVFSATQDIAVDAYRREILPDDELGIGSSIGVYGYRIAMLVASGFGLWVVDPKTLNFSFNQTFLMMAGFMLIGVVATFFATEPKVEGDAPTTLKDAIIEPFFDFFKRPYAVWILLFIILFKVGDSIAGSMLGPFYVDVGFDNKTIAEVTKGIGFISSMAGLFVGGWIIFKIGIYRSLWVFGILQAMSTAFISLLTINSTKLMLTGVIAFEDFSSGMGTTAMVAFMAGMTNKRFTATQYALFASLASSGRTFLSGFAGDIIKEISYFNFFILCSAMAIPGILLLIKMRHVDQTPHSQELKEAQA